MGMVLTVCPSEHIKQNGTRTEFKIDDSKRGILVGFFFAYYFALRKECVVLVHEWQSVWMEQMFWVECVWDSGSFLIDS